MRGRRVLIALLCSLLIVSAGCTSFTANDAESTTTESPTPTGPTDNGATTAEQLAPGLTTDAVTDARALADAHKATLEGEPFVRDASWKRSNATASASKRTAFYFANRSHWHVTGTSEGLRVDVNLFNGTYEAYTAEDVVLKRRQASGNVSYRVIDIAPSDLLSDHLYNHDLVYLLFEGSNVTIEGHSGAVTWVTGTADELPFGRQTGRNVEFTANVAETGLVQSLDLTYQLGNATMERSLSFEKPDENPVEQPDWYETALNQTQANET